MIERPPLSLALQSIVTESATPSYAVKGASGFAGTVAETIDSSDDCAPNPTRVLA